MKKFLIIPLLFCTACSAMPAFFQAADDIETNEAVRFSLSKAAVEKEANIKVNLDMVNTVPVH